MRCFFLVLLLALPITAIAAEATPNGSGVAANKSGCGASVDDALKQAQLSLDAGTAQSQRAALECVIEAVNRLDAANLMVVRENGIHVLHTPTNPVTVR